MPELPEVETLARQLQKNLAGKIVREVLILRSDIFKTDPVFLKKTLIGLLLVKIIRRGKFLGLVFGEHWILWLHLGMSGRLLWDQKANRDDPHGHLIVRFKNTAGELFLRDPRRFGRIFMTRLQPETFPGPLQHLGPEPFEITGHEFRQVFKNRSGRIKSLLLNQNLLAGMGNIYADESLFEAKLDPRRRACRIPSGKWGQLHRGVVKTLEEAVAHGGSTIRDYVQADGNFGDFQKYHRVYGRENEPCVECGTKIRRIVLAGRSTFFCSHCQK